MEKKQKNNKDTVPSTAYLIKFLLVLVVIVNIVFVVPLLLGGEAGMAKDLTVQTGITFFSNAVLLLFVELLERMERKRWEKKAQVDSPDGEYRLLKCSGGYFMLPVVTIFLDLMVGGTVLVEYWKNADDLKKFLQSEEMVFPTCYLLLLNVVCVFVILYYCCYKVYYTRHIIGSVHFLQKKKISCAEIQNIEYSCGKLGKKATLLIETKEVKLKFRSETLSDGWEEFLQFIIETAKTYDIKIKRKNLK